MAELRGNYTLLSATNILAAFSATLFLYLTRSYYIRSPKVEKQRLGLTQLHPDPYVPTDGNQETIDIVAIHGLDSRSPDAWTVWVKDGDPKSGNVHWLKDPHMLRSKIGNARILTHDWPASVGEGTSMGIFDLAQDLLSSLHEHRSRTGTTRRPIIFVASCFGGLIVAKALTMSSAPCTDSTDGRYEHILRYTVGVAFLGTHFKETDTLLYDITLMRIVAARDARSESTEELAEYLRNIKSRSYLKEMIGAFCYLKDSPKYKFPVVCFYETEKTDVKGLVRRLPHRLRANIKAQIGSEDSRLLVKPSSACLQGAATEPLNVTHNMLSKFSSPKDINFQRLSGYLREFAEGANAVLEAKG
ncbi:hypothetical protein GGR51DRAFT_564237 [Nemania sp. FL0031]|nr:hypothetical protein GGR51DRAFT_564237 [Nemania sp. FL0031]